MGDKYIKFTRDMWDATGYCLDEGEVGEVVIAVLDFIFDYRSSLKRFEDERKNAAASKMLAAMYEANPEGPKEPTEEELFG